MSRTAHALALTRFSADTVLACRCIARHGRALDVRLQPATQGAASSSWRLAFTPGLPSLQEAGLVYAILEWNDAPLRVGVPLHACRLWLANRYPDLPLGVLPDPLLDAAIEAMAADVADSLQTQGNSASIIVSAHGRGRDDVSWPHTWTLSVSALPAGGQGLRGDALVSLEMEDAGLARLAHALSYGRPAPDAIDPDQTTVVLRALLGATTLPLNEFKRSGPGDVILLDRYLVDTDGRLWLATPDGQGLQVQARQSNFVIVRGWTHIMNDSINDPFGDLCGTPGSDPGTDPDNDESIDDHGAMTDNGSLPAASSRAPTHALDTDAIPLRLTFDLGERHVKLGVLRVMQVGEIIEHGHPLADGYVCIRANGAVLGWGELVDIDGRAGVRILSLTGGPE